MSYLHDGRVLRDKGFSLGEGDERISFPPGWLARASSSDLAMYGIEHVPDPEPTPVVPTPDQLEEDFKQRIDQRLEAFAKEKGYDTMDKARLAALSVDFSDDGRVANTVYGVTWTTAIALIPEVREGTLSIPDAVDQLPSLRWETIDAALLRGGLA
jgi:hypothetical protein